MVSLSLLSVGLLGATPQFDSPLPKLTLRAERTYNGVGRAFEVYVEPRGSAKKLTLQWKTADGKIAKEVETRRGKQDLAKLLPGLWKDKLSAVTFLQLAGDGKANGPALVLQPMTNPPVTTLNPETKNPQWSPDEDNTFAGIRTWVNLNVLMETEFGNVEFKMRPDVAPNTVWNFIGLIRGGYYRDVIFHRIVSKHKSGHPFVIQAGDPTGTGMGSPGYSFILEKSSLKHDFGVLGMARSLDPNTNGSQFYVALSREATQHLDGRYVTYGECVKGQEVIKKIAAVEIGPKDDRPVKPPLIRSIKLVEPK